MLRLKEISFCRMFAKKEKFEEEYFLTIKMKIFQAFQNRIGLVNSTTVKRSRPYGAILAKYCSHLRLQNIRTIVSDSFSGSVVRNSRYNMKM